MSASNAILYVSWVLMIAIMIWQVWESIVMRTKLHIAKHEVKLLNASIKTHQGYIAGWQNMAKKSQEERDLNRARLISVKRQLAEYEANHNRLCKFVWGEPLMIHSVEDIEEYIVNLHQQLGDREKEVLL